MTIRAGRAGARVRGLALDQLEEPRAQRHRRDDQAPEHPLARESRERVEQVRDVRAELLAARQQPEVDVRARGLRVVVAGPDVHVAAQPDALAAHDQRHLRVGLEADQAVDDVGARLLEAAGPDDVRLLVEARLDLDQHHDLLAALRGPDQRPDDRRVARRPVQGLLDRQDVGIVGRLVDEPLDRRRERLVRVVDEQVARRGSARTRRPARRRRAAAAAAGRPACRAAP